MPPKALFLPLYIHIIFFINKISSVSIKHNKNLLHHSDNFNSIIFIKYNKRFLKPCLTTSPPIANVRISSYVDDLPTAAKSNFQDGTPYRTTDYEHSNYRSPSRYSLKLNEAKHTISGLIGEISAKKSLN